MQSADLRGPSGECVSKIFHYWQRGRFTLRKDISESNPKTSLINILVGLTVFDISWWNFLNSLNDYANMSWFSQQIKLWILFTTLKIYSWPFASEAGVGLKIDKRAWSLPSNGWIHMSKDMTFIYLNIGLLHNRLS